MVDAAPLALAEASLRSQTWKRFGEFRHSAPGVLEHGPGAVCRGELAGSAPFPPSRRSLPDRRKTRAVDELSPGGLRRSYPPDRNRRGLPCGARSATVAPQRRPDGAEHMGGRGQAVLIVLLPQFRRRRTDRLYRWRAGAQRGWRPRPVPAIHEAFGRNPPGRHGRRALPDVLRRSRRHAHSRGVGYDPTSGERLLPGAAWSERGKVQLRRFLDGAWSGMGGRWVVRRSLIAAQTVDGRDPRQQASDVSAALCGDDRGSWWSSAA